MNDFDDLRQVREAKENTGKLERQKKSKERLEEEERHAKRAKTVENSKKSSVDDLNDTVVEVLEALKRAVYPDSEVYQLSGAGNQIFQSQRWTAVRRQGQRKLSRDQFIGAWGILDGAYDDVYTGYRYISRVLIALEFNESGEPLRFVCSRRNPSKQIDKQSRQFKDEEDKLFFKPVMCGLTRDELIHALKELHPPNTIG
jgi:hypothetical protein